MDARATSSPVPTGPLALLTCATCAVRNSSLCSALTDEELRDLHGISRRKTLAKGQFHAFEQGAQGDFVNVIGGFGKLIKSAPDGRQQIVGLLFPSDFVSNHSQSDLAACDTYMIEAASPLELCLFPRERFEGLLTRYPELAQRLLEITLDELSIARDWMVLLGRKSAEERVASFFLHVSKRMSAQSCSGAAVFDLPLDRSDIADHIGLTLETVSRQISKLRASGLITMEGTRRVVQMDVDGLTERAGF